MGRKDRRNAESGMNAQRGFIFQSIIAMIECLERDDWDAIKMEPGTNLDKVDIMLYRNREALSAIQVKSSKNPFTDSKAKKWLQDLKSDANGAREICLCLVGDSFNKACEEYIDNTPEIRKAPFQDLPNRCTEALTGYIKKVGIVGDVRRDDLELVDDRLFAKIHRNSISKNPISRSDFEKAFRNAMPVHKIPLCLTFIPAINQEVGLVGRDDIKRTIRAMLEENSCTALVSGIGGIGKTAVMRQICHDLKTEGKYVAWVECGDSLWEDLLHLRTALGIPDTDSEEVAYGKVINEIRSRLSGRMYLFMDNLSHIPNHEEQDTLTSLGIHVMATSRFELEYFANLSLDILEKKSAIDMFYGYYKGDKERRYVECVWEIIDSVHSHTLLVELLARTAWEEGGTLENFCGILKEEGFFSVSDEAVWTDHDSVQRTIEECIRKLYEISDLPEIQQHIMRLFTIFTPEKEIYYKVRDWGGLDRHGLRKLVALGWLDRGGLENGYRIHQVVRDSLTKQMEHNGENIDLGEYGNLIDKITDTNAYLSSTVSYEFIKERLVFARDIADFLYENVSPIGKDDTVERTDDAMIFSEKGYLAYLASSLLNNLALVIAHHGGFAQAQEYYEKSITLDEELLGARDPKIAVAYNNRAALYTEQGNYAEALIYYEKALTVLENEECDNRQDIALVCNNMAVLYSYTADYKKAMQYFDRTLAIQISSKDKNSDVAKTYNNIAGLYASLGDGEKALTFYDKALSIRKGELGEHHIETVTIFNNMAVVYAVQAKFDEALKCYNKTLAVYEELMGTDHFETVSVLQNMASVYSDQGDYRKALDCYKKVLAVRKDVLGERHPDTATTYNNMAYTYKRMGMFVEAVEFLRKALDIYEDVFGTLHPKIAGVYNNLATVYENQGYFKEALDCYNKSLAIKEVVLGINHPETAATYNNIALVYEVMGYNDKSLEYYWKAIEIYEKALGTDHPDTATTYNNIAVVFQKLGNYEKARAYFAKALSIRQRALGQAHPDIAATFNNMAVMYEDLGEYEKAQECYGKALDIYGQALDADHPDIASTYNNMAGVFKACGDLGKSLECYNKALDIFRKTVGTDHLSIAATYNNIAGVFRLQGNYGDALENYMKSLDIKKKALGDNHPDTAVVYNNIAGIFYAMGSYEEALSYYKKALAIQECALGKEYPDVASTYNNIAGAYYSCGDYERAHEYYSRALEIYKSVFGENHTGTKTIHGNLMRLLKRMEQGYGT